MNRRTRHLVVLIIAVVTASLASFGVYRAMGQLPGRSAERVQSVVVAARPLIIGTLLTDADVKVVQWPSSSLVPGAIADVKEAINRGLLVAVLENEPLTSTKLASPESGAGLSPVIPPGMRAMSVRVDDVIGVAGFIVPGSRVDVVVTIRKEGDGMTRTAASNVQVLVAGTRKDQGQTEESERDRRGNSKGETVVTLMVSPTDAERIALAQSEGEIMLVLRNPLDKEATATSGVRTAALVSGEQSQPPAPVAPAPAPRRASAPKPAPVVEAPPPAAPPAPASVEAIRGGKRTDEVIK
jgi:pilus assembly protein CpaB